MDINQLHAVNVERAKRWHGGTIETWSALEWAGAMCGEAGEAANAAKKLLRIDQSLMNINESARSLTDRETACAMVAKEVADTILYGLLLMARVGCTDPAKVLRAVFNAKSEEYGFPERIP